MIKIIHDKKIWNENWESMTPIGNLTFKEQQSCDKKLRIKVLNHIALVVSWSHYCGQPVDINNLVSKNKVFSEVFGRRTIVKILGSGGYKTHIYTALINDRLYFLYNSSRGLSIECKKNVTIDDKLKDLIELIKHMKLDKFAEKKILKLHQFDS